MNLLRRELFSESLPRARDGALGECWLAVNGGITPACAGRGGHAHQHPCDGGITPACAGRGPPAWRVGAGVRNHSRVRGTGTPAGRLTLARMESLPRARDGGSPNPGRGVDAGNHSRVRGTGGTLGVRMSANQESLPRARDGASSRSPAERSHGITPACAGRGVPGRARALGPRNHSRVRGTGSGAFQAQVREPESLPRARDGGLILDYLGVFHGITPACAGRGRGR